MGVLVLAGSFQRHESRLSAADPVLCGSDSTCVSYVGNAGVCYCCWLAGESYLLRMIKLCMLPLLLLLAAFLADVSVANSRI